MIPALQPATPSTPNEHSIRYRGWRVAAAASTCVLVSFASLLVYTFAIFLKPLAAEVGWSREAISAAFGIAALAVAACSPPIGWLLDRYPARRIILPCLTVFGVAVCLFALSALGTFLLAGASSLTVGVGAAALIGFGMGGEGDVTPYLISRYFGLKSFSTLYAFTWTAYAIAGAVGPIIMGRAFDATGSYRALLLQLTVVTLAAASLMLLLPRYQSGFSASED